MATGQSSSPGAYSAGPLISCRLAFSHQPPAVDLGFVERERAQDEALRVRHDAFMPSPRAPTEQQLGIHRFLISRSGSPSRRRDRGRCGGAQT